MDNLTTIGRLFGGDTIAFSIPNYQRAYQWRVGKEGRAGEVDTYLNDIKDQPEGTDYFLGHYLFEESGPNRYALIDGQQRLTTTVIFMSRLVRMLRKRGIEKFEYRQNEYYTEQIFERYLKHRYGKQKFETVQEDAAVFNQLIIGCADIEENIQGRKSEQRIKEAARFFDDELEAAEDPEDIYRWFCLIDNATITTFVLRGEKKKVTATQIFAFQNDRGLGLTTLEKLKAYLMHQIYRNDSANAESNIKALEGKFATIYNQIERLRTTDEDTVLGYHCQAFLQSYSPAMDAVKESLGKEANKTSWILNFADELCRTYALMGEIEHTCEQFDSPISDVCILDKANSMPLVLKLCHYNCAGQEVRNVARIDEALRIVEKILFKMTYTVAGYRTNGLIAIAKGYRKDGYRDLLNSLLYYQHHGFKDYWDFDGSCLRYFTDLKWHYRKELRYVLYKYENHLRSMMRQPQLSPDECTNVFRNVQVQNTLDHITPQDPDFAEYTKEFRNDYLNNLGNLTLLTWGNNSAKKNHNPAREEIMEMYNSVYYSQKEIYETLKSDREWGKKQIEERKNRIVDFIKHNWLE